MSNNIELSIFMSYTTRDSERFHVNEFAQKLSDYEEIIEVLYCEEDIHDDFIAYMNECVGKCDMFLLFCSERSIDSEFVGIEWRSALSLGKIIIPIFINKENIPPLLASLIGVKFNQNDIESTITETYQLILRKITHYMKREESIKESKPIEKPIKEKKVEMEKKEIIGEYVSFGGARLPFYEAEILQELENLLNKKLKLVDKISDNISLCFTVNRDLTRELVIRNVEIRTLPDSIGGFKSLEQLSLENNKLDSLPDTIGKLSSLKILNLSNNSLQTLPDTIENLKSLEKLYLDNNFITTLPNSISNLNSLQLITFGNKATKSIKESHKVKKILKKLENNGITILKKL